MKKRYLVIGLLASSLAYGQRNGSPYQKKKLSRTDVQAVFSYYTQDNDHSAVTGGIGTEDLQVYAQQLSIDVNKDSVNTFHVEGGVDVISSASTDNIDFEVSSASKVDARVHMNLGYNRLLRDKNTNVGVNSSFSIESDYTSWGGGLSWNHRDPSGQRELSVLAQAFFDDLRWGRFENGKPQKLIYPAELRYKEWFDIHKRNSFNLELGWYQVINRRTAIGFYPGISYQSGLLSTPFHRVYFTDDSKRVENLPESRLKIPVGIQLNTFIGARWILRATYRFYADDFGIVAHAIGIEAPVKISPVFTLTPLLRVYTQTKADYFKPHAKHDTSEEFYTSDYDLSAFQSFKPGMGIRYAPFARGHVTTFNEVEMRYAFYKRSDGLEAHMVTLLVSYTVEREQKQRAR